MTQRARAPPQDLHSPPPRYLYIPRTSEFESLFQHLTINSIYIFKSVKERNKTNYNKMGLFKHKDKTSRPGPDTLNPPNTMNPGPNHSYNNSTHDSTYYSSSNVSSNADADANSNPRTSQQVQPQSQGRNPGTTVVTTTTTTTSKSLSH